MHPRLIEIFQKAYRDLSPRAPMPEFRAEFFAFSNVNNTIRLREGRVLARVSDLLQGAPEPVLYAIAHILLAKLYRKEINAAEARRYREFVGRRELRAKSELIRQLRGRKHIGSARGQVYDLEQIFDLLNARYFHGLLGRPRMTWSQDHARNSLGHYDPAHNTIVVSRVFDSPCVPRYAVEYIVFHEMLHLKHPVKVKRGRRCVHPPEFLREEEMFPQCREAKQFLRRL
jgi:hypothetical protein